MFDIIFFFGGFSMFDNIGSKIKSLAKICTWVGIIFSFLAGFLMFATNAFVGILTIVVGSIAAWVGSFLLYGFGQLIENSDKLVEASKRE